MTEILVEGKPRIFVVSGIKGKQIQQKKRVLESSNIIKSTFYRSQHSNGREILLLKN